MMAVAADTSAVEAQRIRRTHGPGARIGRRQVEHGFLVRDGDIGADEAAQRQPQQMAATPEEFPDLAQPHPHMQWGS